MDLNKHALHLGGILANFQSLEFILRAYLHKVSGSISNTLPAGTNIYESPIGTELPLNAITNYDTLGELIDRFNQAMQKQDKPEIDRSLVDLRDALAHGRVSASGVEETLRIVKFSKPKLNPKLRDNDQNRM